MVLESNHKFESLLQSANEIINKNQKSCTKINLLNKCTSCKLGYQLINDDQGLVSCALIGSVFAHNMNEILTTDENKPIIYNYRISSLGIKNVTNISFMINIKIPQDQNNQIGLIKITSNKLNNINNNNNNTENIIFELL